MSNITARVHRLIVPIIALCLGFAPASLAGGGPGPLIITLDQAQSVVVGKIVDLAEESRQQNGLEIYSKATLKVDRVLKGDPKLLNAPLVVPNVLTKLDREIANASSAIRRVHQLNDEGVWLIMPDGQLNNSRSPLDIGSAKTIETLLSDLDKRVWSKEYNGLKAFAGLAEPDFQNSPAIIFALKNTSKTDVGAPDNLLQGMLTLTATDSAGKEYDLSPKDLHPELKDKNNTISCEPLNPGSTRYMHDITLVDGIVAKTDILPPGKYTIAVSFSNSRDSKDPDPINAWKGQLFAPPFTLEISKPSAEKPQ